MMTRTMTLRPRAKTRVLQMGSRLHCILENIATKKRKQLVYFDNQNVNSLFFCIKSSCKFSVFLWSFSMNIQAFYHACHSLIGYPSHYIYHFCCTCR